MKKLFTLLITAMSVISCSWSEHFDPEEVSFDETQNSTVVITTRGNVSTIRTGSGVIFVEMDSVKIADGYEIINVNDTIHRTPWNIDLTSEHVSRTEVLEYNVKEIHANYIVYELRVRFYFRYYNMFVPIVYTRNIVSAVHANGTEGLPSSSIGYHIIAGQYMGTEPLITDEESHSRSYYDLVIEVRDQEEHLGTLLLQLSFYTSNASITFDAEVSNYSEHNTETNF